jgi:hypothetical protein
MIWGRKISGRQRAGWMIANYPPWGLGQNDARCFPWRMTIMRAMTDHSMQSTTLNFLADDGAVTVTFTPAIDGDQYIELFGIATGDFGSSAELSNRIKVRAYEWGVACQIDGC